MLDFISGRLEHQCNLFRQQFARTRGLPWTDVLTEERLQASLAAEQVSFRQGLYTPVVTLWTFLTQVFSSDHSCRAAVARLMAWMIGQGRAPCGAGTGGYCKARARLSEKWLARLVRDTGRQLHERCRVGALQLAGRSVYVVDGTTVSMPDTPANQRGFPQSRGQRRGLGFPLARLVALFSLASGAACELEMGRYRGKGTGEPSLLRKLLGRLPAESVLLGDRNFCSFWMFALLLEQGVYGVFRLNASRMCDFRRGERLGPDDHLVIWRKPKRPKWMSHEMYNSLPDEISVREVRVRVNRRGFRVREMVVATTLLDPHEVTAAELAQSYYTRWSMELDLRSLKISLQMDILRGKSPEIVRKEIWAHLLVYNVIREVMAQAAVNRGRTPREVSFKGTLQTLDAFRDLLLSTDVTDLTGYYTRLLAAVASHRVGHRPGRFEPRAIKRRPKPHDLLLVPRDEARKRLLHND